MTIEMGKAKSDVITFKVDEALKQAMKGVPNRSEFIRRSVLAALESACPVCNGTGILSLNQKDHWERFAHTHSVEECRHCHETHIVCLEKRGSRPRSKRKAGTARSAAGGK